MMDKLGQYILHKNNRVAVLALVCALLGMWLLLFDWFAAILVGLITLQKGYKSGLVVLAWVALPALSLMYLRQYGVEDLLLARCALVWLFASLLRRKASWSWVIDMAAVLGVVAVGIFYFVQGGHPQQWWSIILTRFFAENNWLAGFWHLGAGQVQQMIQALAKFATGLVVLGSLLDVLVMLYVARWWQSRIFNRTSLREELLHIRGGRIALVLLMLGLVALALHPALIADFVPVLFLPFTIGGFSLFHAWVAGKNSSILLLLLFYFFVLIFSFLLLIVAAIGFFDSLFNFRKHKAFLPVVEQAGQPLQEDKG